MNFERTILQRIYIKKQGELKMPFIYERISDEDKKRVDSFNMEVNWHPVDTARWVIDRELDAFLIWAYPEREPPFGIWYAFYLHGKIYHVAIVEGQRLKTPDGKWIVPVKFSAHMKGTPKILEPGDSAFPLIMQAVEVEIRGNALVSGWGNDICEVSFEAESNKKGAI